MILIFYNVHIVSWGRHKQLDTVIQVGLIHFLLKYHWQTLQYWASIIADTSHTWFWRETECDVVPYSIHNSCSWDSICNNQRNEMSTHVSKYTVRCLTYGYGFLILSLFLVFILILLLTCAPSRSYTSFCASQYRFHNYSTQWRNVRDFPCKRSRPSTAFVE